MSLTTDLSSLLRSLPNGRMSENEVKSILRQLLEQLEPMHSQHPAQLNLHIHPDNIVINGEGNVVLKSTLSGADGFVPGYAPEEQVTADRDSIGPWTDMFGLGATVFKLVTGQNPPTLSVLSDNGGLNLNVFPSDVSLPFRQLVQYMMRPVRFHRPRSVADIRTFMLNKGLSLPDATFVVPMLQPVVQPDVQPDVTTIPTATIATTTTTDTPKQRTTTVPNANVNTTGGGQTNTPANQTPGKGGSAWLWVCIILLVVIGAGAGVYFAKPKFLKGLMDGGKHKTSRVDRDEDKDDRRKERTDEDEEGVTVSRSSFGIKFTVNGQSFIMVPVNGDEFVMGRGDYNDETPHNVRLSDYYIGQTELTVAVWKAVTDEIPNNDYDSDNDNVPVVDISYNDCLSFIKKLNGMLPDDCDFTFRLPTEAEWEYAARGGNNNGTIYSGTDSDTRLDANAWYEENSDDEYHPVAQKKANRLGLYDMSGNVWEWCHDWYDSSYYSMSPTKDPQGPASGEKRVMRGGSYSNNAGSLRTTYRLFSDPDNSIGNTGMRLAADKN